MSSQPYDWPAFRSLCALALVAALAQCGPPHSTGARPNVVLIVVDTLRADAILDPDGLVDTPNIDRLAADGVAYTQAFSHAPMTLPSHTALFSSRPPVETGVYNNGQTVPDDLPLLAEWLREYGYETHAVISLGTLTPLQNQGLNRGFDTYDYDFWQIARADQVAPRLTAVVRSLPTTRPFFLFAHFSDPHEPYTAHGTTAHSAEILLDGEAIGELSISELEPIDETLHVSPGKHVIEGRSENVFRVAALQVFEEGGRRVSLTWETQERAPGRTFRVSFNVDEPTKCRIRLRAGERLDLAETRRRYLLEVNYVDRYVGRLLDELRVAKLYESSLIVFTSDHGEALGERGVIGHVRNLHDEMLHVPLIIKPPLDSSHRNALLTSSSALAPLDCVAPTILDVIGVPPLPGQKGISLTREAQRTLIAQTHKPEAKRDLICIRDSRFKLLLDIDASEFELYDMKSDPGEEKNRFEENEANRPGWTDLLQELGAVSIQGTRGSLSGTIGDDLKALGYADEEDDDE